MRPEARQEYATQFQAFKLKKEAKAATARKTLTDNPAAKVDLEFGDEPKEPAAIRYVTNDSSYEALGELLIGNPTGINKNAGAQLHQGSDKDACRHYATAKGAPCSACYGCKCVARSRLGQGGATRGDRRRSAAADKAAE